MGFCSCRCYASLGTQIQLDVIIDTAVSGILIFGAIRVGRGCSSYPPGQPQK